LEPKPPSASYVEEKNTDEKKRENRRIVLIRLSRRAEEDHEAAFNPSKRVGRERGRESKTGSNNRKE